MNLNLFFAATTWMDVSAMAVLAGLLVCRWWVIPAGMDETVLLRDLRQRLDRWVLPLLGALTVTSAGVLASRTAEMNEIPLSAVAPEIPTVVLQTHYGMMWLVRLGALALLWTGGFALWREWFVLGRAFMIVGALLLAWCVSGCGHAADAGDFSLPQWMDWLHIVTGLVWGGSLIVTALAIGPLMLKYPDGRRDLLRHSARRLSTLAGWSLLGVLLTGSYNTWMQIGAWEQLWTTDYGRTLSLKVLLVVFMILLGAINRYANLPRLSPDAAADAGRRPSGRHAQWFFGVIGHEAAVLLIALFLVARLLHLSPPHAMEGEGEEHHHAAEISRHEG